MSLTDLLAAAVAHHKAGKLDQAAALYDTILAETPEQPDALHHSALVAFARGDKEIAVDRLTRAARACPDRPVVHNDLGAALRIAGRLADAEAALARAVALDGDYADAWSNLGFVRRALGDHNGACAALLRAIALKPGFAPAHNALGVALTALKRTDEAAAAFKAALAVKPDYVEALSNLGLALHDGGESRQALEPLGKAVALAPTMAEAWLNLGLAQRGAADLTGAETSLRRAIAIKPALGAAWTALGAVLAMRQEDEQACAAFRRAVELEPGSAEALNNYGLSLRRLRRLDEARAVTEKALALDPHHAGALFNRATLRHDAADFAGALADWRAALAINPQDNLARSNIMFLMQYDCAIAGAALCEAAREYDRVHGRPQGRFAAWPNPREAERRLKVGYVSPDFREHSVAHYLEPLLAAHDPAAVEVFAYAEVAKPDDTTDRLKGLVQHWRTIVGWPDIEVARQIRADGIDILVDLAGHSANNRLGVFALKPAPVQMTWLGYPGTTGLSAIDYRLTDSHADPPGAEAQSTETLVRLPRGFHCWRPPRGAPAVAPRDETRPLTFGSFNNSLKISAATVSAWARILHAVPEARLRIRSNWLSRPRAVAQLGDAFARQGIGAERMELLSWIASSAEHLAGYDDIDIALDPFPYNGTTTTLEALWMGVPVLALAGERHAGRVGVSLLTQIGAPELIAESIDDYVAKAIALARDKPRIAAYRSALRERLAASPLLDTPGFARDLEAAYRTMWRRWCQEAAGSSANEATLAIRIPDDVRIVVPASLENTATYVLLEQEDWFEDEIGFVRRALEPGQRAIDIGANFGVYTAAMAARVGPSGFVHAFEPSRATSAFLAQTIALNRFENVGLVKAALSNRTGTALLHGARPEMRSLVAGSGATGFSEAVATTTLDRWAADTGIGAVDVVKVDAEGAESDIIAGGQAFLRDRDPLVMVEIRHGGALDLAAAAALIQLGYDPYRLVPGLGVLVPVPQPLGGPGSLEAEDGYRLNLFCCRPTRAQRLAQRRLLVSALPANPVPWAGSGLAYLRAQPFFAPFERLAGALQPSDAYPRALDHYAAYRDSRMDVATRAAHLAAAADRAAAALLARRSVCRMFTAIRIFSEFGARQRAVDLVKAVRESTAGEFELDEPFLCPVARYDAIPPDEDPAPWIFAQVTEARERLLYFSGTFAHTTEARDLSRLATTRFHSAAMERRRQLRRLRAGTQDGLESHPLLAPRAADHLNPDLWDAERRPIWVSGPRAKPVVAR